MTEHSIDRWRRDHFFLAAAHAKNARRTQAVLILTVVMMVAEIVAGTLFGSMALLADGWHMGSHAAALGIAAFAYAYAHRHAANTTYAFGTGKVGDLGAFASALVLGMIAVLMAYESVTRLFAPVEIAFGEAILVAAIGLVVNFASAWMLKDDAEPGHGAVHDDLHVRHHAHHHTDDHGHRHGHRHGHGDHNLRAAYLHVLADALTSLLAIAALVAGLFWGLNWLDPAMGIVGAVIIARWAWGLLRMTGRILLDADPSAETTAAVRAAIERDADNRVADLHVWRLGPGHLAAVLTVVTHTPRPPGHYKNLLADITGLSHVTVEVELCCGDAPQAT
ncbi:MAG: cation transporter [Rhodospirillaceae bacterium]|nr:cation transporter [Rhodospirillaceae bacterium]